MNSIKAGTKTGKIVHSTAKVGKCKTDVQGSAREKTKIVHEEKEMQL